MYRLKEAREKAGLTQKELAEKTQIKHYQQIGRWERGEVDISVDNLKKIAKALNVSMDELAGD